MNAFNQIAYRTYTQFSHHFISIFNEICVCLALSSFSTQYTENCMICVLVSARAFFISVCCCCSLTPVYTTGGVYCVCVFHFYPSSPSTLPSFSSSSISLVIGRGKWRMGIFGFFLFLLSLSWVLIHFFFSSVFRVVRFSLTWLYHSLSLSRLSRCLSFSRSLIGIGRNSSFFATWFFVEIKIIQWISVCDKFESKNEFFQTILIRSVSLFFFRLKKKINQQRANRVKEKSK